MAILRVLVFGSTGSGKTSICNAISGYSYPTASTARGVTFHSTTFPPFDSNGNSYVLTDTVGLNESNDGTVSGEEAIAQIIKLIHTSRDGYNLLVHVMRAPRITQSHVDNYRFFVDKLAGNNIPVILVVTGCENEDPMDAWARKNHAEFTKGGMNYRGIFATCFAEGGKLEAAYKPLRQESTDLVLKAISANALLEPRKIYETRADLESLVKQVWNYFCDFAGLGENYRLKVNEGAYDLLVRLKIPPNIAKIFTEIDVKEVALKLIKAWFK